MAALLLQEIATRKATEDAMQGLTETDLKSGQNLIDSMVLDKPDVHALDVDAQGVVLVTCGICQRIGPIFKNYTQTSLLNLNPHIITIALNGGALLLANDSPLSRGLREDRVIIEHIRQASRGNGMKTAALLAHAPCAATEPYRFSLLKVIDLLVKAKARLKWELVGMKAACFLGMPGGNTYFVSQKKWDAWVASQGPAL